MIERSKSLAVLGLLVFLMLIGVRASEAQERKTFEGKVIGMRMKLWLDVENHDKAVMNFRIGRRTVYTPHRYPNSGETVKVEYELQKGIPIAFTVTMMEGSREVPKGGLPESPKEGEKERAK